MSRLITLAVPTLSTSVTAPGARAQPVPTIESGPHPTIKDVEQP